MWLRQACARRPTAAGAVGSMHRPGNEVPSWASAGIWQITRFRRVGAKLSGRRRVRPQTCNRKMTYPAEMRISTSKQNGEVVASRRLWVRKQRAIGPVMFSSCSPLHVLKRSCSSPRQAEDVRTLPAPCQGTTGVHC